MMGEGIAIIPEGNIVAAPADGTTVLIPETRHAFGMKLADGFGIACAYWFGYSKILGGEGFSALVDVNTEVKAGDPIIKVDTDFC